MRTNYFHVIDPDAFREFMDKCHGAEEEIRLFERMDESNNPVFAFGVIGGIFGYIERTTPSPVTDDAAAPEPITDPADEDEDDYEGFAYREFFSGLQRHLAPGDACIIFMVGNEGLECIDGDATIITKKDMTCLDLAHCALRQARKMLRNRKWETQMFD